MQYSPQSEGEVMERVWSDSPKPYPPDSRDYFNACLNSSTTPSMVKGINLSPK